MEVCHPSPISTIHKKEPTKKKIIENEQFSKLEEYDLKKNFFDPSKSPSNNKFMVNLYKRFFQIHENSSLVKGFGDDDDNSEILFDNFIKK
jgi:hypothetical protein